ncbi:hypothetical protein CDD83_1283 [Cordyceps sp. RAO-2017]|nr:hypothetical protein CDD83_1283 [Cordyceps sp. RAO-2017]
MKLNAGLVAASCGLALASQPAAEVYLLPAREASSTATSLPAALARLVLLQRLAPTDQGPSSSDFPKDTSVEEVVSALNRFGKSTPPLFADGDDKAPSQLVVMLEGMTRGQMDDLGRTLGKGPAMTIPNPPSTSAHNDLVDFDFYGTGATNAAGCKAQQITNPHEKCWGGKQSAYAKLDFEKDSTLVGDVLQSLKKVSQRELQTTLVLLPSTANSGSWSDRSRELRRRQAEQVMTSVDQAAQAAVTNTAQNAYVLAPAQRILSCFPNENECASTTNNCSGHGSCMDKYAKEDGSTSKDACFVCHCLSTRSESGSLTHWAGQTCAKKDVSVAFWLFAGFTLALVGIVWLAISMLLNVGQEKLPGVIGAGVSRSR